MVLPQTQLLETARYCPPPVQISLGPLLRMQGYKDLPKVRNDVRSIAEWAARRVEQLAVPVVHYRRMVIVGRSPNSLRVRGVEEAAFHSQEFGARLQSCQDVIGFVLSLGLTLDQETTARLEQDDVVEALFLECAGWIAVEQASRAFAAYLQRQLAGEGLCLSRRLAPGYFDWPLEEQKQLFGALGPAELPVKLLESCAMLPKKSRSGLYGLQPLALRRSSQTIETKQRQVPDADASQSV